MRGSISLLTRLQDFIDKIAEDKRFTIKLFALAFVVRVLFTLLHPKIYLISDMIGYNEAAMSMILDGEYRVKGVISAVRPPVYPFFLAFIYYIIGHDFLIVRLIQAVIGALTAVLTFKIGAKMFDRSTGVLAGLAYALYTASWAFSDLLLTECLFTFLMMLSVWFMMKIFEMRSPWVLFWAGFFTAAATLARTAYAPYMGFIFAALVILRFRNIKLISRFALAVVIFFMALLPWMMRTYYTKGAFTLNPKSGGDFFLYNHSNIYHIIQNYEDISYQFRYNTDTWDEVDKGRFGKKLAMEWIKKNPDLFVFKGVRMIMNIWGFDRDYHWYYFAGYYGQDPKWLLVLLVPIMAIPFAVFAPLFFAGFVISRPFDEEKLIPTLTLICLHILTFIVYGFCRHRYPFVALVVIWSAYAVMNWDQVKDTLKGKRGYLCKWAVLSVWVFLAMSWLLEIIVDGGAILKMQFQYPIF
ncbi:glycosyltransferase family 39 protein [bacterium]|nr:glycosyltransferase family 39 protein [bacterium]